VPLELVDRFDVRSREPSAFDSRGSLPFPVPDGESADDAPSFGAVVVDPERSSLEPVPSVGAVEVASDFPSAPDRELDAFVALDTRSFLAQPLPLKWTAGVLKPLRSVPSAPQAGQNRGPSALMPWMTSVTRPHEVQT